MSVHSAPPTVRTRPNASPDAGPDAGPDASAAERLSRMAFAAIALGDWPQASAASRECLVLADPLKEPAVRGRGLAAAGVAAAVRGDSTTARQLLGDCERTAVAYGLSSLLDVVQLGRGVEALSAGRYDEAFARLRQLITARAEPSAWVSQVTVGFLAEAGLHASGDPVADTITSTVARLTPSPGLVGATAYARAMTGPTPAAASRLDRALDECPAERAFDRARINLARGVYLRRERKVLESRRPLQESLVAFERLGASAWAEHARRELRATGARRAHRELGAVEALTEQELQIVRLAAMGLTNREIGQRLYLSHRTIGSHLYRAFPKLGIAARSQLRDMLAELVDQDGTPERAAR